MTWYAAHLVLVAKYKRGSQRKFPIWENIVLVRATSARKAFLKAEALGELAAGDDDGSFQWQGKDARWEFAGVRKLVECETAAESPGDGDELTYNELELDSLQAVGEFARGRPATASFQDRFCAAEETSPAEPKKQSKRA